MKCVLRISDRHYRALWSHLYPGDNDEHGAVLHAGLVDCGEHIRLVVREVYPAIEGSDYVAGTIGYRALAPKFIHSHITRCRDERLVYLAVHNHGSDDRVSFSHIDMQSHERGYPALRDIAKGMPVGALVLGTNSVEADIWMPNGSRLSLDHAIVVGPTIRRLYSRPQQSAAQHHLTQDRQLRMFGSAGQGILARSTVAVIGLGGVGSLVCEYLSRLGVGHLVLVDPDVIDESNLSRVVGATQADVIAKMLKVKIAERQTTEAYPRPEVLTLAGDVADGSVAKQLRRCDFIFLAADSMRSRLVFNALVHQFLIPGVQLGAKVEGRLGEEQFDAWSAVRAVRPGDGCLWCNQLIDRNLLAQEAKSDEERRAQAYGTHEPNPSVITLNAVAAAHGVNDFLFDFLGIRPQRDGVEYRHLHAVAERQPRVLPRVSHECRECGAGPHGRYGMGDSTDLPTFDR
jgi:hypothetical protein